MLRLLGFPKAKPESGPGCSYCLASRLFVQSQRAGGPRRARRRGPGGYAALGLVESLPIYVCLPPPGIERTERRKDVTVLMTEIYYMVAQDKIKTSGEVYK